MGYSERVFADSGGLTAHDLARLASDGLVRPNSVMSGPITGYFRCNGKLDEYTLDPSRPAPTAPDVLPEHIVMAALFLASFVAPICHLLG